MIDIEGGRSIPWSSQNRPPHAQPADFAKLVDVFDRNGVSFVAVTQQFNTTTSMGRLTLNILCHSRSLNARSPANASATRSPPARPKACGWAESRLSDTTWSNASSSSTTGAADLVRDIFRRYAEHGSAARLVRRTGYRRAYHQGMGHPVRPGSGGAQHRSAVPLTLLRNRIYLGEIQQSRDVVLGPARPHHFSRIVGRGTRLHSRGESGHRANTEPSIRHCWRDFCSHRMANAMLHLRQSKKNGRQYRYYVPYLHKRRNAGASLRPHMPDVGPPASRRDRKMPCWRKSTLRFHRRKCDDRCAGRSCQQHPAGATLDEAQVVVATQRIGDVGTNCSPAEQQRITRLLIERVQLHGTAWISFGGRRLDRLGGHQHASLIEESQERVEEAFGMTPRPTSASAPSASRSGRGAQLCQRGAAGDLGALTIKRRQNRKLMIPPAPDRGPNRWIRCADRSKRWAKAFYWQRLIDDGNLLHDNGLGACQSGTRLGCRGPAHDHVG